MRTIRNQSMNVHQISCLFNAWSKRLTFPYCPYTKQITKQIIWNDCLEIYVPYKTSYMQHKIHEFWWALRDRLRTMLHARDYQIYENMYLCRRNLSVERTTPLKHIFELYMRVLLLICDHENQTRKRKRIRVSLNIKQC